MSVIITGITIPDNCWECPCCKICDEGFISQYESCNITNAYVGDCRYSRDDKCPLIPYDSDE